MSKHTVTVTVDGTEYQAELDGQAVTIWRRDDGGTLVWSGDGRWDGAIDCTADLGDEAYAALDAALAAALDD